MSYEKANEDNIRNVINSDEVIHKITTSLQS